MKPVLFKALAILFIAVVASAFVSMMGAFLGSQGGDLRELLRIQLVFALLSALVTLWLLAGLIGRHGLRAAFHKLAVVPGWVVFAVCAVNTVVFVAELSFLLILYHTGESVAWQEHLPAASAFLASLAFLACYARYRLAAAEVAAGRAAG